MLARLLLAVSLVVVLSPISFTQETLQDSKTIKPVKPVHAGQPRLLTHACICDAQGGCGNNAVGGDYGNVVEGIPAPKLDSDYGPNRTGAATTGWVCVIEGPWVCQCVGQDSCGNDARGGSRADQYMIPAREVLTDFRPWRTGKRKTGWACTFKPGAPLH